MTRFSFSQACLLHVSGELGVAASDQLEETIARSATARAEHEDIKADFEMLHGMPGAELSRTQQRQLAGQFKAAIHGALWRRERRSPAYSRWKVATHVLAGALGLAACLTIALGIQYFSQRADGNRRAAVARAEQSMRDYLDTDSTNLTDYTYRKMESDIQLAEDQQRMAMNEVPRNAMVKLLDGLDTSDAPSGDLEPGSL